MQTKIKLLSLLIGSLFVSPSFAANFQLYEQSGTLLGQADAGSAVTDDPSAQYYNPAETAFVTLPTFGISGIYVDPSISYTPTSATNTDGQPVTGQTGSPAQSKTIPALFYIQPVNQHITLGFGMTVPFGLSTSYGYNAVTRYFATESQVETVNLNPSVAYKFTDNFSGGLGLDVQYMKAILNQAVYATPLTTPFPSGDIYLDNEARDWAVGWNAGFFYKPFEKTKIGLSYRSEVHHNLQGTSTIQNPPSDFLTQGLIAIYGLTPTDVSGGVTLPDYATLSIQQDIAPRWSVMGDAEYIDWSTIRQIRLTFTPQPSSLIQSTLPPATTTLNYHNTWRLALGQSYKFTKEITGRMGVAYDESPVSPQYATARIPDSDRYWLTTGATYAFNPHNNINVSYGHIFFKDSSINQSMTIPNLGTQTLAANYKGSANLFGLQFNSQFG